MVYLVSYATSRFYKSQEKLTRSALKHGVDKVKAFREADLKATPFYERHKRLLKRRRGAGYWIWKPYLILKTMKKAKENDLIVYSDAGMEVIRPLKPLFDLCRQHGGRMLFQTHKLLNRAWTKRDCFVLMNCDSAKYWDAQQLMGSFCLFVNNRQNRRFVKEWLSYCCSERVVSDAPNRCGLPNFPEFRDHRHDQSVLSLLAVKHGIEVYRAPCQHGNGYKLPKFRHRGECKTYSSRPYLNSPYDTLLYHHRNKKTVRSRKGGGKPPDK